MRALFVWVLLSVIWGSTWLFIKLGLEDLPPLTFAGIRFLIASLLLLLAVAVRRVALPRNRGDWRFMALTGFLAFTLNYGLLFWGQRYTSCGQASLLNATIPIFGLLIAHRHLPGERVTWRKVTGVAVGLTGVSVIFLDQMIDASASALGGSAAIVLASVSVAYSNVLVKARGSHLDPALLAGGQMFFGFIPLLLVGTTVEGSALGFHWTARALWSLGYLSLVGSALAFLLFYWLVKHMDVTRIMLIALATPLTAVVLGMLVLGERLNWRVLAGGSCILSGIGLMTARRAGSGAESDEHTPEDSGNLVPRCTTIDEGACRNEYQKP